MKDSAKLKVLFIAGFGPIVRDTGESRKLYRDALGIPFKEEPDGYLHTEAVPGAKSFALWPLSQVALSCFGKDSWPKEIPAPQAWLEFDVESVEKATEILKSRGYRMLVKNKKEPWGQNASRAWSRNTPPGRSECDAPGLPLNQLCAGLQLEIANLAA